MRRLHFDLSGWRMFNPTAHRSRVKSCIVVRSDMLNRELFGVSMGEGVLYVLRENKLFLFLCNKEGEGGLYVRVVYVFQGRKFICGRKCYVHHEWGRSKDFSHCRARLSSPGSGAHP
jgi:hypothetical protein